MLPLTAGSLVLALLEKLSEDRVPWVYLRNYEQLPESVGNDVDLLVPFGQRWKVALLLTAEAERLGWRCLGHGNFSPIALYFCHLPSAGTVHLDIFDRLEWHCLEYAEAAEILRDCKWNGLVNIPEGRDEVYLNVVTRLLYQGEIRTKHRSQALSFPGGLEGLREGFQRHLGPRGSEVVNALDRTGWVADRRVRRRILIEAILRYGLKKPLRLIRGLARYGRRVIGKLLKPPGRFMVLEGADGVGKSTVLEEIIPWCKTWCGGREAYRFHWKPVRVSRGVSEGAGPVDPRGRPLRSRAASFIYLTWHLAGFWWGYFRRVRPLLAKSHAVVGDRYSYDIFLDPRRFRLRLPDVVCRWAALLAPKPDLVVALLADPEEIHRRKSELSDLEISDYQARWKTVAKGRKFMRDIPADDSPAETVQRVKRVMLETFSTRP